MRAGGFEDSVWLVELDSYSAPNPFYLLPTSPYAILDNPRCVLRHSVPYPASSQPFPVLHYCTSLPPLPKLSKRLAKLLKV